MSERYIKFDTARSYLREACTGLGSNGGMMLMARFDNEPTIELHTSIIFCKECAYNYKSENRKYAHCALSGEYIEDDWFCGRAERKEDE